MMSSSEHEDVPQEDGIGAQTPVADPAGNPAAGTTPPTRRDFVRTVGKFVFLATLVDLIPTERTAQATLPCGQGNPDAGCNTTHKDGNCTFFPDGNTEDQSCGWLGTSDEHCGDPIPAGADPDGHCGKLTGDPSQPVGDGDEGCAKTTNGVHLGDENCGVDYFGGIADSDCGAAGPDNYCTGSGDNQNPDNACQPEQNSPDQNCGLGTGEYDATCGTVPYPGKVNGPDELCGLQSLQADGACSWRDKDQSCQTFADSPKDESCGPAWPDQNCSKQTPTTPGDFDESCGTHFSPSGTTIDHSCCHSSPGDGNYTEDQTYPIFA